MRPRRSSTSNQDNPRSVFPASLTALPTASANDRRDVPTSVISFQVPDMGISLESELTVMRAAAPLGRGPGDDLIRIGDIACLAVHAVREVDLQALPAALRVGNHFIHRRGTEEPTRVAVLGGAAGPADLRVGNQQMGRLV